MQGAVRREGRIRERRARELDLWLLLSGPRRSNALRAWLRREVGKAARGVMTIDDAGQIRTIAQASKKGGYRLRTVIENLVLSELFQKR